MKIMRCLFLALALGLGWGALRAQGQTTEQVMSFSVICQYTTNLFVTNLTADTLAQDSELTTVILNSANLVKAMAIDLEGTNWTIWAGAQICYEINLNTSNAGIFLRRGTNQINASRFFTNRYSSNSFASMFSTTVTNVFSGTNYTTLPLIGGWNYFSNATVFSTNLTTTNFHHVATDNLAYLTFSTTNISFTLFGVSQAEPQPFEVDGKLYQLPQLLEGVISGAGTFSLNVTTNVYNTASNAVTYVPATNYTGLAHGTVYVQKAFDLDIGPPEGP